MDFLKNLEKLIEKNNSLLCIGLDPDLERLPQHILKTKNPLFEFNKSIIDETHDLVCCYKPNIAFYSALGIEGLNSLQKTINYIHNEYKDIPVILDAKRGDIGNTAEKYAKEVFYVFQADAVTVSPYLGFDSLEPFLKYKEKGIIILCRTSNKSAQDFQDTQVSIELHLGGGIATTPREVLHLYVAKKVVGWNKQYNNCLLVVGGTRPEQLKKIREIAKEMFFLVPGIGSQGGDLEKTLKYGLSRDKSGLIISVSRAILYSENPRKKAEEFNRRINMYR